MQIEAQVFLFATFVRHKTFSWFVSNVDELGLEVRGEGNECFFRRGLIVWRWKKIKGGWVHYICIGGCTVLYPLYMPYLLPVCNNSVKALALKSVWKVPQKYDSFFTLRFCQKNSLANVASHFLLFFTNILKEKLQICHPDIQGKCRQRFFAVNFQHKSLFQIIAFNSSFSDFLTKLVSEGILFD